MWVVFLLSLALSTKLGWSSSLRKTKNETVLHLQIENCGYSIHEYAHDSHDRIIGGRYAQPGEFPWIVSLRERSSLGFEHVCGGAILNERWIITAAHCFDGTSPRMYDVVAGLHKLSEVRSSSTAKIYKLSKIILHSDFNDVTFLNDIALMKTSLPMDIKGSKGYITGVCLPKPGSDPRGYATVSGWGHTVEGGENSNTLKVVDVPIIPRNTCNQFYDENPHDDVDEIVESMICAGLQGRDSCQNDSGGPLIQYDDDDGATLIGVISFGIGCGLKFFPGVYTRVSCHLDWINANAV